MTAQSSVATGQDTEGVSFSAPLIATAEALEAYADSVVRARFDVKALAETLAGASPEAVRDWVGANTRLVGYRGTLKGAAGALEDQAGNSLDRALLLAAVLTERGVNVRLTQATLSDEAAAALMALTGGARPALADDEAGMAFVERLKADPRIDAGRYGAFVTAETERMAALTAKGEAMTAALSAALTPLVSLPDAAERNVALLAALADHWWVQAEVDGAWVDLDPAASAAGSVAAAATMAVADLPEEMKHKVTIRVVSEVAREGALQATTLVETTLASADVQGALISIAHRIGGLAPMDELDGSDQAVIGAAAASKVWAPMIIGEDAVKGSLIAATGEIADASEANFAKYAGTSGFDEASKVIDALGGEATETAAAGVFTAEWIEVEIASPGAAAVVERRMIFDAIGPAARASGRFEGDIDEAAKAERGLALQDDIDLMVMTGRMAGDRSVRRTAALVAVGLRALAAVSGGDEGAAPPVPDGYRRPAPALSEFAASRFALLDRTAAEIAAPNVAMLRSGSRANDGELTDRQVFDIVDNAAEGAPAALIAAGIADTVAEHLLLGASETSDNTAARHAADIAAGRNWIVLTPGGTEGAAAVAEDENLNALIAADLGRGFVVVAPPGQTMASATWWRIDPSTGRTLGMTAAGGAETVEFSTIVAMYIAMGTCTYKMSNERKKAATKKQATAKWFDIPRPKRAAILGCYAGAIAGTFFGSAAAMGLLIGAASTFADER